MLDRYLIYVKIWQALTRTLADYLDVEQVTLRFMFNEGDYEYWQDIQFWGYYDRQTDTFVTKTSRELREMREE